MRVSAVTIPLVLAAVIAPLVAYVVYPGPPSAGDVIAEVSEGAVAAGPLGLLVESLGHGVCYRGFGAVHGPVAPVRGPAVAVSGELVLPAPGLWVAWVGGVEQRLTHRDVAELIRAATEVEAEGPRLLVVMPGEGRVLVLVATRINATVDGASVSLRWAGGPGMHGGHAHDHQGFPRWRRSQHEVCPC